MSLRLLIKKDIKVNFLYLIFCLLTSIAVVVPLFKYLSYSVWGSWGDYNYSLTPSQQIKDSPYVENTGGGYYAPFVIASAFPYLFILSGLSFTGLSPFVSTLLYVIIINFISSFLTFISFSYFSKKLISKESKYLAFLLSLIYVYSPYFSTFYKSGHFNIVFTFTLFPAILMFFDKILESKKIEASNYFFLFIVFSLFSNAVANFAYLLVYFLALGVYFLGFVLYKRSIKVNYIISGFLACLLLVLSHSWWFFSATAYHIKTFSAQVEYSRDNIGRSIGIATEKSTLERLLFNEGNVEFEKLPGNIPTSLIILVYLILFSSILILIINSNRKQFLYLLPFILLLIFSLFLVKGPNAPYGKVFSFLYDNISVFQIFRRPDSKVYWIYLFAINILALLSLQQLFPKMRSFQKKILEAVLALLTAFILFLYSVNIIIIPFNVPNAYYEASDVFKLDKATRILVLPDLKGLPPYYDSTLNGLRGYDFISQVWKYEILGYDLYGKLSLNNDLNSKLQRIYETLSSGSSACIEFKELGISHVVLKQNLINESNKPMNTINLEDALSRNSDFNNESKFFDADHPLFVVWRVKDECRSVPSFPFTVSDQKVKISYNKMSPTYYEVKLKGVSTDFVLSLMRGYDKDWKLYLPKNNYRKGPEFLIPFNSISNSLSLIDSSKKVDGYTNRWLISKDDLEVYIKDNKEVTLMLNYFSSIYLYLGILTTLVVFMILVVPTAYKYLKRIHK